MRRSMRTLSMTKWIPFVNFVLMLVHVTTLVMGYDFHAAEIIEVCLGFILIHMFSRYIGFCLLHRIMIYYAYTVTVCIWYQRYFGFGTILTEARITMLSIGIIILITAIWKKARERCSSRSRGSDS